MHKSNHDCICMLSHQAQLNPAPTPANEAMEFEDPDMDYSFLNDYIDLIQDESEIPANHIGYWAHFKEWRGEFFWFTQDEYVQWRADFYNVPASDALQEFQYLLDVHILLTMEEDGVKYFFIVKYDVEQYFGIGLEEDSSEDLE